MIDLAAWDGEPAARSEAEFTPGGEGWSAWNEWSPEVEVADWLPVLAATVGAELVVETGVGQGYATRRLMGKPWKPWKLLCFESDGDLRGRLRSRINGYAFLSEQPTPGPADLAEADLVILDSEPNVRAGEIRAWLEHGKPGSWCYVHDADRRRPPTTGYWQLWKLCAMSGLPMWEFDNPRGSVLMYRGWQPTVPDRTVLRSSQKGSVLIAQIDGGEVAGGYAHAMVQMMGYSMQYPGLVGGYIRQYSGPRVWHSRDQVVRHFLTTGCDWLLQVDTDMTFRWDLLERLMSSADPVHRPIVAGHCYMVRGESGPLPTMWTRDSDGRVVHFEGYPAEGLVAVEATGSAVILIHRRVFETMWAAFPDHPYPWYEETHADGKPYGEDLTFCLRARSHGFPIYVDTALNVGHVKPFVVDRSFFADWRRVRRTVVTGVDVDRLAWVRQLLQQCGVAATWERVFTGPGVQGEWGTRWVDVSRHAVGFLPTVEQSILVYSGVPPVEGASLAVDADTLGPDELQAMLTVCRAPGSLHPRRLAEIIGGTVRSWQPVG